jgi:hypothetical protein
MSIEADWERYRDTVIPKGAHEGQLILMRHAFYAGSSQMFDRVTQIFKRPDGVDVREPISDELVSTITTNLTEIVGEIVTFGSTLDEQYDVLEASDGISVS